MNKKERREWAENTRYDLFMERLLNPHVDAPTCAHIRLVFEVKPVRWPDFLLTTREGIGLSGIDALKVSVGELSDDQINALYQDFRAHCARKRMEIHE